MARCHILYWIWLSLCISPGSSASDILLEYFDGSAQKIYEAGKEDYDKINLPEDVKARLMQKGSEEARSILRWCNSHDVRLLAYDDPDFPARLQRIGKRPVLLYCKGRKVDFNDSLLIAMVGTRAMSSYGKRTAYTIAHDLSCAGAVVVSGMALGIDSVCHRGALDAHGDTIAVLGCGIDITYPKQNLDLMLELEKKGLIISEYKPGSRPSRFSFPIRNRIISGLCQGTFVVEGDKSSGSMITAKCAISQGRDLFALPGMVGEQNSEGTNALLREGATPVTCAADLLADYSILYPDRVFLERIPVFRHEIKLTSVHNTTREKNFSHKPSNEQEKISPSPKNSVPPENSEIPEKTSPCEVQKKCPEGLSAPCQRLFDLLNKEQKPLSIDSLTAESGLDASTVMTSLTILEIKGHVASLPGGRFVLN